MLSAKLEKICLPVIRWGSYLILLLPVVVYSQVLFPYVFSKVIIFRIIVECLLAIWLLLIIYNKSYRPNWRHPLILTATIFLGALFITSIFGVDFYRSFWSNQERMTGIFTLLHLWLWFIILTSVFKKWSDWAKLIGASLACSVLVGLYGFGQNMGLKFLLPLPYLGGRMISTLGNPIFLGTYAMLNIFLGAFLFLKSKQKLIKVLTVMAMVFNVIVMLLAGSRGAVLSFSAAILIFIIFFVLKKLSPKTKTWGTIILILLLLAILSAYVYLQTPAGKPIQNKLPYLSQFLDFKALTSGLDQRTIPWQIAWQGFKERPVLGWGWENYNVVFNKYYQPKFLEWGLAGTWFDRSHNQIMDFLATSGIVGTLAYLLFYGTIFYLLLRKKRDANIRMHTNDANKDNSCYSWSNSYGLVILALMFAAYFLQNLTSFDAPAPLIVFYLGLGLVYFITSTNYKSDTNIQITNEDEKLKIANCKLKINQRFPLPLLIFILGVLLVIVVYRLNLKPFIQSKAASVAFKISPQNFDQGLLWYQGALAIPTFVSPGIRSKLFQTILTKKISDPNFLTGWALAAAEMTKSCQEHPQDARYWLCLGQLYDLNGRDDQNNLTKGQMALEKALALSPQRQQIYFELAQNKILQGSRDGAIQYAQTAVALDQKVGVSYYQRGAIYFKSGKYQEAIDDFNTANNLGYGPYPYDLDDLASPYLYISSAQVQLKKYDEAIATVNNAIYSWPNNVQLIVQRIMIYEAAGNRDKIKTLVDQIRISNPGLADQLQARLDEQKK